MRNAIRTITLCLLCLVRIEAQDFHLQTNVTQVPCQKIYYTGILFDGGKCESVVLDHNCEVFERNMSNWSKDVVFVLRSSTPQDVNIVWRDRTRLDGIVATLPTGPRLQRQSVAMPPMPLVVVPPPIPPITIQRRFQQGQLDGVQAWMTNSTTNVYFFETSTNLINWTHAGNEQAWADGPWMMTETGVNGQIFFRAHKL